MTLFLVSGLLETYTYPDSRRREPILRIVQADTRDEAIAKFERALTVIDQYGVSTYPYVTDVSAMIT